MIFDLGSLVESIFAGMKTAVESVGDAVSYVSALPGRAVNMALLSGALMLLPNCGPKECEVATDCDGGSGSPGDEADVCTSAGICVDPMENPAEACGDSPLKGKLFIDVSMIAGGFGNYCSQMLYFRQRDCYNVRIDTLEGGFNRGDGQGGDIPIPTRSVLEQEEPYVLNESLGSGGAVSPYGYLTSGIGNSYTIGQPYFESIPTRFDHGPNLWTQFINYLMDMYGGLIEDGALFEGEVYGGVPFIEVDETMNVRECLEFLVEIALDAPKFSCMVDYNNGWPRFSAYDCDCGPRSDGSYDVCD